MGEVKQVGHDFLWEHNTQTDSQMKRNSVLT